MEADTVIELSVKHGDTMDTTQIILDCDGSNDDVKVSTDQDKPLWVRFKSLLSRSPAFKYLWLANVVDDCGDFLNWVSLMSLVTDLTSNQMAVSAILVSETLPAFAFSGIAGVVADRFERAHVMMVCAIVGALAVCGLILANYTRSLWLVFVSAFVLFGAQGFYIPASKGYLPTVVSKDDLQVANGWDCVSFSVILALAASVGGIITSLLGINWNFSLNILSFVLAAYFTKRSLMLKRSTHQQQYTQLASSDNRDTEVVVADSGTETPASVTDNETEEPARGSYCSMFVDGARYMWARPILLFISLFKAVDNMSIAAIEVVNIYLITEEFKLGRPDSSLSLGIMWGCVGVGCLFGTGIALRFERGTSGSYVHKCSLMRGMTLGYAIAFCAMAIEVWSPNAAVFFIATSAVWMGDAVVYVVVQTLTQVSSEDAFRGRVFSFTFAMRTLAYSIGSFGAGLVLDFTDLGPRRTLACFACLMAVNLLACSMYTYRFVRNPDMDVNVEETLTTTDDENHKHHLLLNESPEPSTSTSSLVDDCE